MRPKRLKGEILTKPRSTQAQWEELTYCWRGLCRRVENKIENESKTLKSNFLEEKWKIHAMEWEPLFV